MKIKRIIWIAIVAAALLIQLIPNDRPEVVENNTGDFLSTVLLPDSLANMLRISCYDCHSNETNYPWYAYVAPVKWLVNRDVRNGRKDMNFSNWGSSDKMQQAKMLSNISDEVGDHAMPLAIYPLMHPAAKLKEEERKLIIDWAEAYGESLFE